VSSLFCHTPKCGKVGIGLTGIIPVEHCYYLCVAHGGGGGGGIAPREGPAEAKIRFNQIVLLQTVISLPDPTLRK
jgi:hypothetical protein